MFILANITSVRFFYKKHELLKCQHFSMFFWYSKPSYTAARKKTFFINCFSKDDNTASKSKEVN